MRLFIDTTQKEILRFELRKESKVLAKFEKFTSLLSEEILSELKKFLKQNKVKLKDLNQILVNPGPGGFSSTRTGVAVANALAYALDLPLAEWPSGKIKELVIPKYNRPPNITNPSPHPNPLRYRRGRKGEATRKAVKK